MNETQLDETSVVTNYLDETRDKGVAINWNDK